MTALKSKDEERRKKVPSKLHCFQKIDKDGVGDQKAAGREGIKAAGKMGEAVGFAIPENAPRGFLVSNAILVDLLETMEL